MTEASPSFSIVIPTHRRPDRLATCIATLARLDYPRDRLEVIVVDDGGTLGPTHERSVLDAADGVDVRIVRTSHQGPGPARNMGIATADGDCIAFTDDDCRPDPGWLSAFAHAFTLQPDALLGGRIVNGLTSNLYAEASQDLIDFLCDWFDGPGGPRFLTSNNMAASTAMLRRIGGFDPSFVRAAAEDRELVHRWWRLRLPRARVLDAVVYHEHEMDLGGFLRQHFRYGRGAVHYRRALARSAGKVTLEPRGFYSGMLRHPFARHPPARAAALAALIVGTQLANLAGYLVERHAPPS